MNNINKTPESIEKKLNTMITLLENLLKIQLFSLEIQGFSASQILDKDLSELHVEVTELLHRRS